VVEAVRAFHIRWRGALGLSQESEVPKKHWSSIKALTRRLSEEHGKGSTFRRARVLIDDIYEEAIPRARRDESYENRFSRAVLAEFEDVAAELYFIVE